MVTDERAERVNPVNAAFCIHQNPKKEVTLAALV